MRNRVYIIAEAGVNHNGDMGKARELIDAAVWAGADAVKLQLFKSGEMTSVYADKAQYQKDTTDGGESQLEMLRKLELGFKQQRELKKYAEEKGITFLTSPFDMISLEEVLSLKLDYMKIPSPEIINKPYLQRINESGVDVILSTGMSNLEEVSDALKILKDCRVTLLHCNTEYPTPYEDVNLNAMVKMREEFGVRVGYSDHTLGIQVPTAAVALGAEVIEKHFTLDKDMEGPDHRASLEPEELKSMVEAIRTIEVSLGDGIKVPSKSEEKNIGIARKSLVVLKDMEAGEVFSKDKIGCKRPGSGISPMRLDDIVGKRAKFQYKIDELVKIEELE